MLSSEPGAKAMCMAIGMATAKQRKAVAKSLREHVAEVAMHETGHMVLIRLLESTDDTVRLSSKRDLCARTYQVSAPPCCRNLPRES